jgi:hypothetical protein
MREQGRIWPVASVLIGAFVMLFVVPLGIHRAKTGQMATVEPHVMIGDGNQDNSQSSKIPSYRWPDSEVPRTAERLRDLTGIAIASMSYVVEGALKHKPPRDSATILAGIADRDLIPRKWLTDQPGVLHSPYGTIYLRYSATTLSVEVVSVPSDRTSGPALLVRLPDPENVALGPRYFESMQLDGIVYPHPFAPLSQVITSGWQQRLFKQTSLPEAERAQLEQWSKSEVVVRGPR